MDNKWTPEPWPPSDSFIIGENGYIKLSPESYDRARECVNALAGQPNPKEYIETILKHREELAEQVKELTGCLDDAVSMIERLKQRIPSNPVTRS